MKRQMVEATAPFRVCASALAHGLEHLPCAHDRYMEGTSMATPLIAASAALVRQYFLEGFYPGGSAKSGAGFAPSGALVKAVLLGGAAGLGRASSRTRGCRSRRRPASARASAACTWGVPCRCRRAHPLPSRHVAAPRAARCGLTCMRTRPYCGMHVPGPICWLGRHKLAYGPTAE